MIHPLILAVHLLATIAKLLRTARRDDQALAEPCLV